MTYWQRYSSLPSSTPCWSEVYWGRPALCPLRTLASTQQPSILSSQGREGLSRVWSEADILGCVHSWSLVTEAWCDLLKSKRQWLSLFQTGFPREGRALCGRVRGPQRVRGSLGISQRVFQSAACLSWVMPLVVCPISCNLSSLRPPRCVLENGKSSWSSVMCACSPYTRWWAVVGVSCHLHAGILYSDATLEFLRESVKLCGSGELCCLCANPND